MPLLLQRLALVALGLGSLVAAGHLLRARLGIALDVETLRELAEAIGPMAPILFVLVVAGRGLLWLPSQVVLIAAGLCFGAGLGALVGGAGLMISGVFLFALARYAGRESVERRIGTRGRAILDLAAERRGTVALALASSYPLIPISPLQASAGLTAMRLPSFMAAAFAGGTIRASTYAFFGDAMIDLDAQELAAALVLALIVVALPLALPAGRRWLRALVVPASSGPSQPES